MTKIKHNKNNLCFVVVVFYCCCCVFIVLFVAGYLASGFMAGFQGLQAMGANYLVHGLVGHNEKKPLAPKTPKLCFVMQ